MYLDVSARILHTWCILVCAENVLEIFLMYLDVWHPHQTPGKSYFKSHLNSNEKSKSKVLTNCIYPVTRPNKIWQLWNHASHSEHTWLSIGGAIMSEGHYLCVRLCVYVRLHIHCNCETLRMRSVAIMSRRKFPWYKCANICVYKTFAVAIASHTNVCSDERYVCCVYDIHTMCVLFVCLYIAAHCRTPECKSVRPDWSFRTLLLAEHYRSTTRCSMSTIGVLLRAQWALLSVLCVTTQCQFHTTFLYILVRFSMSTTRCQF